MGSTRARCSSRSSTSSSTARPCTSPAGPTGPPDPATRGGDGRVHREHLADQLASLYMPRRAPITTIDDPRYLKAVSHPVRVRILAMLDEGPASPKVLADRLGISLGVVAYHVRTLHELDLLKLVGTR